MGNNAVRIKVGQTYTVGNDSTIIWEWAYKGNALIRERIIGYYHGEPNDDDLREFAYGGVDGLLDVDDVEFEFEGR